MPGGAIAPHRCTAELFWLRLGEAYKNSCCFLKFLAQRKSPKVLKKFSKSSQKVLKKFSKILTMGDKNHQGPRSPDLLFFAAQIFRVHIDLGQTY